MAFVIVGGKGFQCRIPYFNVFFISSVEYQCVNSLALHQLIVCILISPTKLINPYFLEIHKFIMYFEVID